MLRAGLCALFTLVAAPAIAQGSDVDWKFYGGVPFDGRFTLCFYDAKGVLHQPGAHIRVWTKCLSQKDINVIDIQKDFDGAILENTAHEVASYYVPPIALVEKVDANQAMTITQYEETADIAGIEPVASIFYELNCPERMERELSVSFKADDKKGFSDKPLDWKYVPPEGNAATLLQILCPAQ